MSKGNVPTTTGGGGNVASKIPPQMWLYIIGIPVAIGVGYFGVIRPVLKKFGVIKSQADKEFEKLNKDVERQGFWKATWYKENGGSTLSDSQARHFAAQLAKAMDGTGTWYDVGWGTDEEAIASVFRQLGSKGNISRVAEAYNQMYNKDLLTALKPDELSEEEFTTYVSQPISQYGT